MLFKFKEFFLITLIFTIILTFPSTVSLVFGKEIVEIEIKNELINPGSFYYSFKRLWEKGLGQLMFSQNSKISFHKAQLKSRLAELKVVVDEKILSEVQRSSERFAYQAGILTNEIVKKDDPKIKGKLLEEFEKYDPLLQKLRDRFEANSSFWMLVQHDINTLKILSERLK